LDLLLGEVFRQNPGLLPDRYCRLFEQPMGRIFQCWHLIPYFV